MFYEIESVNGEKITISCSDDGTIVYTVGKRKTTFSLAECSEYIFSSCDGTSQRIVCGEDGVDQLTLIMLHGEERLERNNDERETRRHDSLSDMPDKYDEKQIQNFGGDGNPAGRGTLAALLWRSDYAYRKETCPFEDF